MEAIGDRRARARRLIWASIVLAATPACAASSEREERAVAQTVEPTVEGSRTTPHEWRFAIVALATRDPRDTLDFVEQRVLPLVRTARAVRGFDVYTGGTAAAQTVVLALRVRAWAEPTLYDVPGILRDGGAADAEIEQLALELPRYFDPGSALLLEPSRELSIDYGTSEVAP
jgi:hypothetical protein